MTTRHRKQKTPPDRGGAAGEAVGHSNGLPSCAQRSAGPQPQRSPTAEPGQEWPSELPRGGGSPGSLPCARGPETCSHLSGPLCLCAALPLSESRLPLQGSPWGHRAVCYELPLSRASLSPCSASPSRASSVPCHHPSSAPFPATRGWPSPLPSPAPFRLNHAAAPGKVPRVPVTPPPPTTGTSHSPLVPLPGHLPWMVRRFTSSLHHRPKLLCEFL